MAVETTYGKVHAAYAALLGLVQGRVGTDDGWKPQLPLTTILRYKRIMGVLRPLAVDYEEMRGELFEKVGYEGVGPVPKSVREELRRITDESVTVGVDTINTSDFGNTDKLPVSMIGFFMDVEPFLKED